MFTKEQIKEIADRLAAMGKRDSEFPHAGPIKGDETVAIVQDSANRNITVQELASYILEKEVTLTVRCSTKGSKIWLNNIPQSSITVKSGELVTIKVTADGYIPLNEVTCVHWDQTIDVVLDKSPVTPVPEPEHCTFTITPVPSNATVMIDGQQRTSVTVEKGTQVSWSVTASGYKSQSGTYTVNSDYTMTVTLQEDTPAPVMCTLTVSVTPADAVVKIDGVQRSSITVEQGTRVHVTAEKSGYRTGSADITVNEVSQSYNMELEEIVYCTLTVTHTPEEASCSINEEYRDSITVEKGTKVLVLITCTGYKEYREYVTVDEPDQTLHVDLELKETWTFTLYVDSPENCTVKVDGVTVPNVDDQTPYTAEYEDGDYVRWEVSKEGYLPQSNRFYIHDNTELHITLEEEPEPTEQIIARCLEGEQQIEGMGYVAFDNDNPSNPYDSINLTASQTAQLYGKAGEGYAFVAFQDAANPSLVYPQNPLTVNPLNDGGELVSKEYILLVQKLASFHISFNISPSEAVPTVTLNGSPVENLETGVDGYQGTEYHWKVEAEGYETQEGDFTLTSDYTLEVTLVEEVRTNYYKKLYLSSQSGFTNVPVEGIQQEATIKADYVDETGEEVSDVDVTSKSVITSSYDWIHVTGNMVTVDENTSEYLRMGKLHVQVPQPDGDGVIESSFSVDQNGTGGGEPPSIELIPETLEFSSEGESKTVNIVTEDSWTLE